MRVVEGEELVNKPILLYTGVARMHQNKDLSDHCKKEVVLVRSYLENRSVCRRQQLLEYFVEGLDACKADVTSCCDVCNNIKNTIIVHKSAYY